MGREIKMIRVKAAKTKIVNVVKVQPKISNP